VHCVWVDSVKFRLWRNVINRGDMWALFLQDTITLDEMLPIDGLRELNKRPYSSILEYDKKKQLALKLIKPQTNPRDAIRKYFHSQAKREFTASLKIQSIGIATPAVFGYAYSMSPFSHYESILFMEHKEGMVNGFEFLAETHDRGLRKDFFKKVAEDINTMYKNRLHHRDCNFGNILVGDNMRLFWIDNDVKIIRNNNEISRYFSETLRRLERACIKNYLSSDEWDFFKQVLNDSLMSPKVVKRAMV
jgi:tRNA A-37 threonylcarbamoyl transferase component Bud32